MMEKPEFVRLATPDDIEPIFWPLMRTYAEDGDLGIPVSDKAVFETVRDMCNGNGGVAGVIDGPHGVIGSMAIRAIQPWFASQYMLTEVWFFVVSAYRKGSHFTTDLFQFAEWHRQDMSERLGYDMVFENAVLSMDRLPAKMRLWEKFYGPPIGGVFWTRGKSDVLRQQFQQDEHDTADEPERPVGLQQSSESGAEPVAAAAPTLSRPNGRAAEFYTADRDSGHSELARASDPLFD